MFGVVAGWLGGSVARWLSGSVARWLGRSVWNTKWGVGSTQGRGGVGVGATKRGISFEIQKVGIFEGLKVHRGEVERVAG